MYVHEIDLCFSIPKKPSFSLQFSQDIIYLDTHLKEELTSLFESYQGIRH